MEANNQSAADYQKGFNEGYLIAQHLPELSDRLSNIQSDSMRIDGFQEGRKQYLSERAKDILPSKFKSDKNTSPQMGLNKTPDRGLEPEV